MQLSILGPYQGALLWILFTLVMGEIVRMQEAIICELLEATPFVFHSELLAQCLSELSF